MDEYVESSLLIEKWRKRLIRSYAVVSAVVFITEILVYFLMKYRGTMKVSGTVYWLRYIVMPTIINVVCILITFRVIFSRAADRWKNAAVVLYPICFCTVIATFHGFYLVTSSIFVLPMAISVMFGEEKIVKLSAVVSLMAMGLSSFLARFFDDNWSVDVRLDNLMASVIFLGVCYVICISMLRFVKEKNEIIAKSVSRNEEMRQALKIDSMTNLYNHTEFYRRLELYHQQYGKHKSKHLTVAVVDVDLFKKVNDTYGHEKGDAVLVQIADILKKHCKGTGHVFRYGGEEFAVIFRHKDASEVWELMEVVRRAVYERKFVEIGEDRLGISCGIYEYDGENIEPQEIFSRADRALYQAKASGRNRCVCYKNI